MPAASERRSGDKADVTALLGAFCFFLSAIEYMIPKPLPFMRLGIANLPILLAADLLPLPWFLVLALVKVVGMSVISGSLFSYIAVFSLAGTVTAALVMWASRKAFGGLISAVGVSVLGAVASNAVQVLIARVLVFGEAAKLIAPAFLATGLATGALLGLFAEAFAARSAWYTRAAAQLGASAVTVPVSGSVRTETAPVPSDTPPAALVTVPKDASRAGVQKAAAARRAGARGLRRERYEELFAPWALAAAGAAISFAFLFQPSLAFRAAMLAFFMSAAAAAGKRASFPATILVSTGIVAANLLVPVGRVLARLGPLAVTETALLEGIGKALTFEGLIYISKASILPSLRIPGRFGAIIAQAFVYYDRTVEYKGKLRPASLIEDADALMLKVWEAPLARAEMEAAGNRPIAGWIALGLAVAAAYALLAIH